MSGAGGILAPVRHPGDSLAMSCGGRCTVPRVWLPGTLSRLRPRRAEPGKGDHRQRPAFHFTLTTAGVPQGSDTTIVGGEGDLARPDKLVGTFTVSVGGLQAAVKVAAGNGKFYAQLPFQTTYTPTDPSSFGVANPAQLISPNGRVEQHPQ